MKHRSLHLIRRRIKDQILQLGFTARNSLFECNPHSRDYKTADLCCSLLRGVDFIRRHQREDGALIDFLLPIGSSDGWMTAHVAWVVEEVPELERVRHKAAGYLNWLGNESNGVWGYNTLVGNDCDSTAQALLVLHNAGYKVPSSWVMELAAQQHANGGYSTFRKHKLFPNGWQIPHPDVTLVVVAALRRLGIAPEAQLRATKWIDALDNASELIPYWWSSPAYIYWCSMRTGRHSSKVSKFLSNTLPSATTVPDLAMLTWASLREKGWSNDTLSGVNRLISLQRNDGSWPCSPCLRLTNPAIMAPKVNAPGTIYSGQRRNFSTAHAVAALSFANLCTR